MADVTTIIVALLGSAVIKRVCVRTVANSPGPRGAPADAPGRDVPRRDRNDVARRGMGRAHGAVLVLVYRPGPACPATDDEQLKLAARVSAYGTTQMQAAFQAVAAAQRDFANALRRRDMLMQDPALARAADEVADREATFGEFDQVRRNRLRPAVQVLLDLANAELAERHASWWAGLRPRWPGKAPMGRK